MTQKIIIKNGSWLINKKWEQVNILLKNGVIESISKVSDELLEGYRIIELPESALIIPGLIDMHVHLREPSLYDKDINIMSETKAALFGGYHAIAAMPNTAPVTDNLEIIKKLKIKSVAVTPINVNFYSAITRKQQGVTLVNVANLNDAAIGFSDDGFGVNDVNVIQELFAKSKRLVAMHAQMRSENTNDKFKPPYYGLASRTDEIKQVQQHIEILKNINTNDPYHVCHISTSETIATIKKAKAQGLAVSCEAAPHHLLLNNDWIQAKNGFFKVNPPLRPEEDRLALIKGLQNNVIDCIATDHAPHPLEYKNLNYAEAKPGFTGIETAFPLLYTHLVKTNIISLKQLIKLMTLNPAKILGLTPPIIKVGQKANFIVIDQLNAKNININNLVSTGKNSPFLGWDLKGWPIFSILKGNIYRLWK